MKVLNFLILLFFFIICFQEGNGQTKHNSNKIWKNYKFGLSRKRKFTIFWCSQRYPKNESEYKYLVHIINGTFLNNHVKDSKYNVEGHYVTFIAYDAVVNFLNNAKKFRTIFGNDAKAILPSESIYLNSIEIDTSVVEFIDEKPYHKVLIDVINDMYYAPFYNLFPDLSVDGFLYFFAILSMIIIISFTVYSFIKYREIFFKKKIALNILYFFTVIFIYNFISIVNYDLDLRDNFKNYINKYQSNHTIFFYFLLMQILFVVSLLSNTINYGLLSITSFIYFIILIFEYFYEVNLSLFIFTKVGFMIYCILVLYRFKMKNNSIMNDNSENVREKFNMIFLMILFELLVLVYDGLIYYSIQFNLFLFLYRILISRLKKEIINIKEGAKEIFLLKF